MRSGNPLAERLLDLARTCRLFHEVDVVDVPGGMELRHEQSVHVPELVLHERAAHLFEAHADELVFDEIEEFPVGMFPADALPGGIEGDVVGAELLVLPAALLQHLGREHRSFFGDRAALP